MHPKLWPAVLSALCLFAACKKHNDSTPSATSGKIKTFHVTSNAYYGNVNSSWNFTYDNQGRILSENADSVQVSWTYNGTVGFTTKDIVEGKLIYQGMAFYNDSLLTDSIIQLNGSKPDTSFEIFTYNGRQLISQTNYTFINGIKTPSIADTYTWDANGNVSKEVEYRGSTLFGTYTWTYTDKVFRIQSVPGFAGQLSKNLPASKILTNSVGTVTLTTTYTYEFDSQGRVTKETDTDSGTDTGEFVKTYTYY